MKKLLLLAVILSLSVLLIVLVGCGGAAESTTQAETSRDTTANAVIETSTQTATTTTTLDTTTALVTTEAVVTTPSTTANPLTENGIPKAKLAKVSELVGTHDFKNEALKLMKLVIRDYYNKASNRVLDGNGNQITLWAVGSFMEALTSVYKAFPEDEELRKVYVGLLDRGVPQYRVRYQEEKVNGVTPYYYNASAGNRGDYYYDDDEWIAIQYLEAYKILGDEKYLTRAQEILEFIWLGWGLQSDEKLGNGGIPWHCNGKNPNTCSNAPAAYAFAMFSTLTKDEKLSEEYLNRAVTTYEWVRKYLRHPQMITLYKDSPDNNWSGSYNNGLMIAAGSLLYDITGDKAYLNQATLTAKAASTNNMKTENGVTKFENDIENPWMNAWLVKGWYEFYKVDNKNTVSYLNLACRTMAFALENKLDSGYLRIRLDEGPDFTWKDGGTQYQNDFASNDCVNLGGGISLLMTLAEWAELYGSNYQN